MSRERLLAILVALVAVSGGIYVVVRSAAPEGVVDHKTISGTRSGTSYGIVVFSDRGSRFDDEEVQGFFDDAVEVNDTIAYLLESLYDDVFYFVSVRSGDHTMAYHVSRRDFNRVASGSKIRFVVQIPEELEIRIIRVLD